MHWMIKVHLVYQLAVINEFLQFILDYMNSYSELDLL